MRLQFYTISCFVFLMFPAHSVELHVLLLLRNVFVTNLSHIKLFFVMLLSFTVTYTFNKCFGYFCFE
jgi:hypothetical protein